MTAIKERRRKLSFRSNPPIISRVVKRCPGPFRWLPVVNCAATVRLGPGVLSLAAGWVRWDPGASWKARVIHLHPECPRPVTPMGKDGSHCPESLAGARGPHPALVSCVHGAVTLSLRSSWQPQLSASSWPWLPWQRYWKPCIKALWSLTAHVAGFPCACHGGHVVRYLSHEFWRQTARLQILPQFPQ